jgi:hypothetical protein
MVINHGSLQRAKCRIGRVWDARNVERGKEEREREREDEDDDDDDYDDDADYGVVCDMQRVSAEERHKQG